MSLYNAWRWAQMKCDRPFYDVQVFICSARLLGAIIPYQSLLAEIIDSSHGPTSLLNHDLASKSNAELEVLIRERVETLYHPTPTTRMAPLENGGVIDPYGVEASGFATQVSVQRSRWTYCMCLSSVDTVQYDCNL